ncbi:MAG: DMT family transporter, partial [Kiloniellales bacterium]
YCLSQAYRLAQVNVVAPFEYVALPWAVAWGFVFWGDIPDAQTMAGISLVVGSGLYVLHREALRGRRTVAIRGIRPRV